MKRPSFHSPHISVFILLFSIRLWCLGIPASIRYPQISSEGTQVFRYERPSALSNQLIPKPFLIPGRSFPNKAKLNLHEVDLISSGDKSNVTETKAFQFTFVCADVPASTCANAKAGFERVGELISNSLEITRTIHVQAIFRSFCTGPTMDHVKSTNLNASFSSSPSSNSSSKNMKNCSLSNVLGQATAAAYFAARVDDKTPWTFYPQPLLKQLQYNASLEFTHFDILAEFNADFNFYFRSSGKPIKHSEIDFEFIVAHELTHGLGFDTAWASYADIYKNATQGTSYLSPLLFFETNSQNATDDNDEPIVKNMQPLNVWDLYVQSVSDNALLQDTHVKIAQFTNQRNSTPLSGFISDFEKSKVPFDSAKSLYSLVTSGPKAITFSPSKKKEDGNEKNSIYLHTRKGVFQPGSSIAHVDYDLYKDTMEVLMIPAAQSVTGMTLDSILEKVGLCKASRHQVVYGPKTLAMLHAIGWPTKENTTQVRVEINANPERIRYLAASPGIRAARSWILSPAIFLVAIHIFVSSIIILS